MKNNRWKLFVDIVTIVWLIVFFVGFHATGELEKACYVFNVSILVVFFADLILIYKHHDSKKSFFKEHWIDVLMIVPYFRIFRIFRIIKLVKVLKIGRFVKSTRYFGAGLIVHEIGDLYRTIKQRFVRE